MATRRTWIWVIVAVIGCGLLGLIAVAGASIYFISKRVDATHTEPPEARQSFDAVTTSFQGRRALYELDGGRRPQLTTPFATFPTATERATDLWVQAWNPNDERLIRLSLPLWLLRFGDHRMRVMHDKGGLDLREFTLDVDELGRIGPTLVLDYRAEDGVRVLLWTK